MPKVLELIKTNFGSLILKMQSVIFYQVNFLNLLRNSIFVKALVNGLALLLELLCYLWHIAIHVLSVACLNYPLFVYDIKNVEVSYCTLSHAQCRVARLAISWSISRNLAICLLRWP